VFLGSGAFAVPALDALASHARVRIVGVVTAPDRPAGRHAELRVTPVAARAAELGLPTIQPARIRAPEAVAAVRAMRPDLGVLADYGQIVPGDLLELPRSGILNVHPSVLPRHRGAAPIQAAILAGDERAGVSIMAMDAGVDTGPILAAREWPLTGTERTPELEARAAAEGAALLAEVLPGWLDGTIRATPQDASRATTTRMLQRDDGRLDPARPAVDLERQVRALDPWPGAFLETADGRLVVHDGAVAPSRDGDEPPSLVEHDGRLAVATANGRLVLEQVQPAGGRAMSGAAFLRGHRRLVGTRVSAPAADRVA
jgi:methionyl-tRNA formyltransferase